MEVWRLPIREKLSMQTRLRRKLEEAGSILQTTSDTEVLAHLMRKKEKETTRRRDYRSVKKISWCICIYYFNGK